MTEAFTKAVEAGKVAQGDRWEDSFVTFEGGAIRELRCRHCNTPIAKLVPHDTPTVRRQGSQTFIQERMVFSYLPNYRELLVSMDDGSTHVTNCCVDCVTILQNDAAALAAGFARDLSQWSQEGAVLSDAECARIPTAVLASDSYIKPAAIEQARRTLSAIAATAIPATIEALIP